MPLKLKLRANDHNMQHALYFKLKADRFARPAFTLYNPNSYTVSLPFDEPMIEIDSDVDFESEDTTEDEDGLAKFTKEWDARDMLKRFEADTEPILVAESIEVQLLRATLYEHMQLNPYTMPDPADWKSLELPEPMRDEDGVPNFSVSNT